MITTLVTRVSRARIGTRVNKMGSFLAHAINHIRNNNPILYSCIFIMIITIPHEFE